MEHLVQVFVKKEGKAANPIPDTDEELSSGGEEEHNSLGKMKKKPIVAAPADEKPGVSGELIVSTPPSSRQPATSQSEPGGSRDAIASSRPGPSSQPGGSGDAIASSPPELNGTPIQDSSLQVDSSKVRRRSTRITRYSKQFVTQQSSEEEFEPFRDTRSSDEDDPTDKLYGTISYCL